MSLPGKNKNFSELKKFYDLQKKEKTPCSVCGVFNDYVVSRYAYPGLVLNNVICKTCGLIRIDPRLDEEAYNEFYKKYFFDYLDPYNRPAYMEVINRHTQQNEPTQAEKDLIAFIIDYVKEGSRVLDIGAGFGNIIYLLREKKNINYDGLEPDPFSREIASKMGIKLIDVNAKEFLESNQNTYDFIILSQTLEHLLEPVKTLQELKKHLTPKGLVYIGVPNSLNPQIPMSLFFQLAHTFNFTNRSLATTAKMAGLKVIKISNPQAFILEAILAHQEFDLPEVGVANLTPGSDWQGVVKTLRRKERLNLIRGLTKKILSSILGETLTQKIKNNLDKIFKYKY